MLIAIAHLFELIAFIRSLSFENPFDVQPRNYIYNELPAPTYGNFSTESGRIRNEKLVRQSNKYSPETSSHPS